MDWTKTVLECTAKLEIGQSKKGRKKADFMEIEQTIQSRYTPLTLMRRRRTTLQTNCLVYSAEVLKGCTVEDERLSGVYAPMGLLFSTVQPSRRGVCVEPKRV